jgi:flagellar basal-body rod protein FlgC
MVGSVNSAALSGLQAATLKLQTNANNLANASTAGFQKQQVTTVAGVYGVEVKVERVNETASRAPQTVNTEDALPPSEVDLLEETIEMGVNKRLYDANLMTLRVADNTLGALLDIKA